MVPKQTIWSRVNEKSTIIGKLSLVGDKILDFLNLRELYDLLLKNEDTSWEKSERYPK